MCLTSKPTLLQIVAVTASLSPVSTFTLTPKSLSALIAALALALGGSRNAKYPTKIISFSSATERAAPLESIVLRASPNTLIPFSLRFRQVVIIFLRTSSDNGSVFAPCSALVEIASISSIAPLVMSSTCPVLFSTATLIRRRLKSKGISSIFLYPSSKSLMFLSWACSIIEISIRFFSPV